MCSANRHIRFTSLKLAARRLSPFFQWRDYLAAKIQKIQKLQNFFGGPGKILDPLTPALSPAGRGSAPRSVSNPGDAELAPVIQQREVDFQVTIFLGIGWQFVRANIDLTPLETLADIPRR